MNFVRVVPSTVLQHTRAVHHSIDPMKVWKPDFRLKRLRHIDNDGSPLKQAIRCAATDSPDNLVPLRPKARAQSPADQT